MYAGDRRSPAALHQFVTPGRLTLPAQKLQRAIAEARGIAPDSAIPLHARTISVEAVTKGDESTTQIAETRKSAAPQPTATTGTKRKYRRHPKVCSCQL
jgi:hypothetical protein